MMTKRTALLAASAAVLVTLEGGGVARAADANWALNYDGSLRWDAVRGGVDSDGSPLYFCRAYLSPGFQPGKVNFNLGSCRYPYGGQEQKDLVYDVLVPTGNRHPMGNRPALLIKQALTQTARHFISVVPVIWAGFSRVS